MSVTTKAALAVPDEKNYQLTDIVVDEPKGHEVLVRMVAVGMCHTDAAFKQVWADPALPPIILGHEGAGVVERTGSAVSGIKPGDRVLITFNSCGLCSFCRTGHPSYCGRFSDLNMSMAGTSRADGTSGLTLTDGSEVAGGFFGQSSFAGYALANDRNVLVVDAENDDDLALLAPFGCSIQTGAGSIFNEAPPKVGETVVIFGTGAVGLFALMAAALTPAAHIVGVDVVPSRLDLARELGATHTVNSAEENVVEALRRISEGTGVHVGVETTGVESVQWQAVEALASRGTLGLVGARFGANFTAPVANILQGRRIHGIVEGGSDIFTFLPALLGLYRAGRFPVDKVIRQYPLDQIDKAAEDARSGATAKPVLRF